MGFIGAAISSMVNLGAATTQMKSQEREAEKNREFQAREAQLQRDFEMEMYDTRMNPEAQLMSQMSGYEKAGLNPALMYGNGKQVGSGNLPSPGGLPQGAMPHTTNTSVANGSFNLLQDMQHITEIANIKQGIENQKTEKLLMEQQINESVSRELLNFVNGDISEIELKFLNETYKHRFEAQISEYQSKVLDYQIYNQNKGSISRALGLQDEFMQAQVDEKNSVSEYNKQAVSKFASEIKANEAQAAYLLSVQALNDLAREMQELVKDSEVRKQNYKNNFESFVTQWRHQYMTKTGIDPLGMNDFQVLLVDALSEKMTGKAGSQNDWDSFMATIDPHSHENVWIDISHGLYGIAAAAVGGYAAGKGVKGAPLRPLSGLEPEVVEAEILYPYGHPNTFLGRSSGIPLMGKGMKYLQ